MKTDAALRKYRDAIRKARATPCECAGTQHEMKCVIGGYQMRANEMLLSWIIDELPEHDRFVETFLAGMSQLGER